MTKKEFSQVAIYKVNLQKSVSTFKVLSNTPQTKPKIVEREREMANVTRCKQL